MYIGNNLTHSVTYLAAAHSWISLISGHLSIYLFAKKLPTLYLSAYLCDGAILWRANVWISWVHCDGGSIARKCRPNINGVGSLSCWVSSWECFVVWVCMICILALCEGDPSINDRFPFLTFSNAELWYFRCYYSQQGVQQQSICHWLNSPLRVMCEGLCHIH